MYGLRFRRSSPRSTRRIEAVRRPRGDGAAHTPPSSAMNPTSAFRSPVTALLFALALLTAARAHAHDPGLSSATLREDARGGRFSIVAHDTDLPEARRARARSCAAPGVLALRSGEREIAVTTRCHAHDAGHTEFEVRFEAPADRALTLELTLLAELARGHRSFLRVLDASGRPRAQYVLSREHPTVELPPRASKEPHGAAGPFGYGRWLPAAGAGVGLMLLVRRALLHRGRAAAR